MWMEGVGSNGGRSESNSGLDYRLRNLLPQVDYRYGSQEDTPGG
jgi:hypothetical protein